MAAILYRPQCVIAHIIYAEDHKLLTTYEDCACSGVLSLDTWYFIVMHVRVVGTKTWHFGHLKININVYENIITCGDLTHPHNSSSHGIVNVSWHEAMWANDLVGCATIHDTSHYIFEISALYGYTNWFRVTLICLGNLRHHWFR